MFQRPGSIKRSLPDFSPKYFDPIYKFTHFIMDKDLEGIKSMLHPEARLEYINENGEIVSCKNEEFMEWISKELSKKEITSYGFMDAYKPIQLGVTILFNEGDFPLDSFFHKKGRRTGFQVDVQDEKIWKLFISDSLEAEEMYEANIMLNQACQLPYEKLFLDYGDIEYWLGEPCWN